MTYDDETRRNILAELVAAEIPPEREPDEVTAQDVVDQIAQETGQQPSLHAVRRRLDSLVRDGRATTRMVRGDYYGRAQRAWRIIT